jgi:hypothetical protein
MLPARTLWLRLGPGCFSIVPPGRMRKRNANPPLKWWATFIRSLQDQFWVFARARFDEPLTCPASAERVLPRNSPRGPQLPYPRNFLALKLAIQQKDQLPDLVFLGHSILNGFAGV